MAITYQGWKPVLFPTSKFEKEVAEQALHQSIAEIEHLISGDADEPLRCDFHPEQQLALQNIFQRVTQFTCLHSRASLVGIRDEVRNRILRWSMALDKAGIRGDGMTFTEKEKAAAHNIVMQGGVMNVGVLGNVRSVANIAAGHTANAGDITLEQNAEAALGALTEAILRDVNLTDTIWRGCEGPAGDSRKGAEFARRALEVAAGTDTARPLGPGKALQSKHFRSKLAAL